MEGLKAGSVMKRAKKYNNVQISKCSATLLACYLFYSHLLDLLVHCFVF